MPVIGARAWLVVAVLLIVGVLEAHTGESNHNYKDGETVTLWVNKVGPYNNPQETYNYYYLPFCKPHPEQKDEHSWGGLGEVLQGNELIDSQLEIKFKVPVPKSTICTQTLNGQQVAAFQYAVKRHYWYELFMDDLPVWGFVGESKMAAAAAAEDEVLLYTHKQLDITYNGDRIIHVNLTSSEPVALKEGQQVTFTFAVNWLPTNTPFHRRFERYLDYNFFEHRVSRSANVHLLLGDVVLQYKFDGSYPQ
eukprot:GHRR01016701.1.p1 GENE.GHRR01016701.1~~GHRR01016701.1.p1  ORF type:complete len:250 (+),score=79.13 GHRR01016701.1:390-1139(+)